MKTNFVIKNPRAEIEGFRRRLGVCMLGIAIIVIVVVARLFYLQILHQPLYTTLSQKNWLDIVPLEPKRGLIYDRYGVLLARNLPVFSLMIIPNRVPQLEATLYQLSQQFHLSEEEVLAFKKQLKQHRRFEAVPLILHLNTQQLATFSVDQWRYPGVLISAQLLREYPFKNTFAHVVGYMGRINAEESKIIDPSNYSATNFIGKTGLEKFYEPALHGQVGYQQVEIDAGGRVVRVLKHIPPIPGNDLHLSIDSRLQAAAEAAFTGEKGALVAIEPATGQVLAIVSHPSFDPNLFVAGISHKNFKDLNESPDRPLYDRSIHGQYPPASTIKPYVGLTGLQNHTVSPDTSVVDPGWFKFPNNQHQYRDWNHYGHGIVNLTKAIMVSCDTYFYTLAHRLGIHRLSAGIKRFGFGQKTGIDLPNEFSGLVPTAEWKKHTKHQSWYPGDTIITGIGQGFTLATPLQIGAAVASLAERGHGFVPTLVEYQTDSQQHQHPTAHVTRPVVNAESWQWKLIINAMHEVIINPSGTGSRFGRDAPYEVAAKTGTAQVFSVKQGAEYNQALVPVRLRNHSLFIAFSPIEHPVIAIAVIAENSTSASGIARKVLDHYLLESSTRESHVT